MTVSQLIKELCEWSPDTKVAVYHNDVGRFDERYDIDFISHEADNFDNVMIVVSGPHGEDE